MALLQSVNSDAGMAPGEDLMELSADRTPRITDDIDIDLDDGAASVPDQDMGDGVADDLLHDDEMADPAPPTITATGDDGQDVDLHDAEHAEEPEAEADEESVADEDDESVDAAELAVADDEMVVELAGTKDVVGLGSPPRPPITFPRLPPASPNVSPRSWLRPPTVCPRPPGKSG